MRGIVEDISNIFLMDLLQIFYGLLGEFLGNSEWGSVEGF